MLYSLLFGEGVANDAVSIIIFNSVTKFQDKEFSGATLGLMAADFLALSAISLLIGICFGIFSALMLKHLRMLAKDAIGECIFVFSVAYLCYVTAESCS